MSSLFCFVFVFVLLSCFPRRCEKSIAAIRSSRSQARCSSWPHRRSDWRRTSTPPSHTHNKSMGERECACVCMCVCMCVYVCVCVCMYFMKEFCVESVDCCVLLELRTLNKTTTWLCCRTQVCFLVQHALNIEFLNHLIIDIRTRQRSELCYCAIRINCSHWPSATVCDSCRLRSHFLRRW